MYELVASGTASSIGSLGDYQNNFPEGSRGYVEIELSSDIAVSFVEWLDERLEAVGVPEKRVEVSGHFIRIYFKTAIPPLVLIAGAIAASIVILALVVAWKLFKLKPQEVVGVSTFIIMGVLAVVVLIATRGRLVAGPVAIGK